MKILVGGGLGNQLFGYAYGRYYSLKDKEDLIISLKHFSNDGREKNGRLFGLDKLNIKAKIVKDPIFLSPRFYFYKLLTKSFPRWFNNNYQGRKDILRIGQIDNLLRQELTLTEPLSPESEIIKAQILAASNPVSIQIRRGDYTKLDWQTSLDFYEQAINYIKIKTDTPTFFIFSDDIGWCKQNFKLDNVIWVSRPEIADYEEIILMSLCQNHIISNSTFAWWGAWLNPKPNKIVIAPKIWFPKENISTDQVGICPKDWIQI